MSERKKVPGSSGRPGGGRLFWSRNATVGILDILNFEFVYFPKSHILVLVICIHPAFQLTGRVVGLGNFTSDNVNNLEAVTLAKKQDFIILSDYYIMDVSISKIRNVNISYYDEILCFSQVSLLPSRLRCHW